MQASVQGEPIEEELREGVVEADPGRFPQFGGQPYFNDFLSKNFKTQFSNTFGEKNGKAMMSATAGSCVPPNSLDLLPS